ncbi:hypothetical protein MHU86_24292 [Fragilaria crotonensis]|nr:hypothetical protein MHU86_24292 [Fragilaria crotonensis]
MEIMEKSKCAMELSRRHIGPTLGALVTNYHRKSDILPCLRLQIDIIRATNGREYVKCRKLEDTQRMYRESNLNIEEGDSEYGSTRGNSAGRKNASMGNNQQAVSGIQPRPLPVATFDDYVQQLDAWEVDLLRHTDLFVDPYTACLELHQGFEAGSDGSEKYGTDGSFGWMISTSQGERVATGMGPSGDTWTPTEQNAVACCQFCDFC